MSRATDRFVEAATTLGVTPAIQRFPEGTKTAEDAARALGCDVAQIVKSLVFLADDRAVLALTSGRHRVDPVALATVAGASSTRRATPDEVRAATGFAVGGTPPFGHPTRILTFLDPELLRHAVVWAGAGAPDSVFAIAPERLVTLSGATVADFT